MLTVIKSLVAIVGWIIAALAGAAAVAAWLSPKSGEKLLDRLRRRPNYDWQDIVNTVSGANTRVLLLQTWFPGLQRELPRWREALLRGGLDFRVLLADQKLVEYRLRSREPVSSVLMQNVSDIRELVEDLGESGGSIPQVRFYSILPFGPIYVIDDNVYFGLYLSQMDSMDGPAFRARADSRIGKDIIASFETAWQEASDRTGLLSVAENLDRKGKKHSEEEVDIRHRASILSKKLRKISEPGTSTLNSEGGYLCILCHAETDMNEAEIITGGLDVGINYIGRENIRKHRPHFAHESWWKVYSSPARRCTETLTELLANPGDVLIRDEFRGRSMGELEGYAKDSYQQSVSRYSGQDVLQSFHASADDGEAYCQVLYRLVAFVESIVEEVIQGKRVLICTHDTVIRTILLLFEDLSTSEAARLHVDGGEPIFYAPVS
jgi:broad specificity phosphatase PhoE